MDTSPLCSSVHGISQVRILEWAAISFSRGSSFVPREGTFVSCLAGGFFVTEPPGNTCHTHVYCTYIHAYTHICKTYVYVCVCMLSHFSCVQLFVTYALWLAILLCPWNSPGKNTGVDCHALLQGIFPSQGLNLFPTSACIGRRTLYHSAPCISTHIPILYMCLYVYMVAWDGYHTLLIHHRE